MGVTQPTRDQSAVLLIPEGGRMVRGRQVSEKGPEEPWEAREAEGGREGGKEAARQPRRADEDRDQPRQRWWRGAGSTGESLLSPLQCGEVGVDAGVLGGPQKGPFRTALSLGSCTVELVKVAPW